MVLLLGLLIGVSIGGGGDVWTLWQLYVAQPPFVNPSHSAIHKIQQPTALFFFFFFFGTKLVDR